MPRLALMLLPSAFRKPFLAAMAQINIKPTEALHYNWKLWRNENIYKLEHTGQVCYLRKALNDKYDQSLRRIYIGSGTLYNTPYLHTEAEAQNKYGSTESEPGTIWLRTEAETAETGVDFIVWVPPDVYNTELAGLEATTDFYKAAGRRYKIMIIP
ncbi:hypothetical protein [Flavobacterium suaedae]|nr:hypothetical protein [Flavobacterium suaedae]